MLTDHDNLKYFMTMKVLSQWQARWAQVLSAYDFTITYHPGKVNPADGPSQHPDYKHSKDQGELMLPTLQRKLCIAQEHRQKLPQLTAGVSIEGI